MDLGLQFESQISILQTVITKLLSKQEPLWDKARTPADKRPNMPRMQSFVSIFNQKDQNNLYFCNI